MVLTLWVAAAIPLKQTCRHCAPKELWRVTKTTSEQFWEAVPKESCSEQPTYSDIKPKELPCVGWEGTDLLYGQHGPSYTRNVLLEPSRCSSAFCPCVTGVINKPTVLWPWKIKVLREIMHSFNELFCVPQCVNITMGKAVRSVSQEELGEALPCLLVRFFWVVCGEMICPTSGTGHGELPTGAQQGQSPAACPLLSCQLPKCRWQRTGTATACLWLWWKLLLLGWAMSPGGLCTSQPPPASLLQSRTSESLGAATICQTFT